MAATATGSPKISARALQPLADDHGRRLRIRAEQGRDGVPERVELRVLRGALDRLSVASAWARLRLALRGRGLRMRVTGPWIAAKTMSLDVPIVTQDDHPPKSPELVVIRG